MALDPSFRGVADSVSCLHALEHFGLGRYRDTVDYDGWRKGLDGRTEILEPGGTLYLGLPTGEPQRVEFNAHRVFSLPFIRDVLEPRFVIERREPRLQHLDPAPRRRTARRRRVNTWETRFRMGPLPTS